ncbi:MAG: PD-(D/E)XK nuclease family protein [Clostridia bacterium]|nr:PD-(D/E)XK nuclease family protein [Clostridia bacterium]
MSLKIIKGRAGSGKSTYMLNDMEHSENALYIVPEQFSYTAEKRIIEKFGISGIGCPQVLSFKRLCDIVFSRYGAPEFITGNASFEMIVSYCANSIKTDKLQLFGGLVKKSEFASTASTLITTFKKYRVTPEKLSYAIENTEDTLLQKKLLDSLEVYKTYTSQLKSVGECDIHDSLLILSQIILEDDVDYFNGKTVYIDQFADFDPSETECIKSIMKRADRVCVALCLDEDDNFSQVRRTYNKLYEIAHEAGISVEAEETIEGAMIGAGAMLRHLEKFYFSDIDAKFSGTDGRISVFCARDLNSEVHFVAKKIVKLVRENNYRYRDISVVSRDAETYKNIVERVFSTYGIPVFIDRKITLSDHCVTLFIKSVLNIMLQGFTYENVFSYVKSPFSPVSLEDSDNLENYALACGIRPYSWKSPFYLKPGIYSPENNSGRERVTDEDLAYLNSLREKVYNPLEKLKNRLEKNISVTDICKVLFEFFEETALAEKIENYTEILENNGENLCAMQTKQVYNILIDLFSDFCDVFKNTEMSLSEFSVTLEAGLKAVEIGTIPSSADCVSLGSIDRIKGHGAKCVFLVGVNNGVFPAAPTSDGLFSESDKEELSKFGIEMPPGVLHKAQSEQMLTYDALTCASEILTICYPVSNGESPLTPSEIVNRVINLFEDIECTDDILETKDTLDDITVKRAVFEKLSLALGNMKRKGEKLSPLMSAAANYFKDDKEYSALLSYALKMAEYKNEVSLIDTELIEKAVGKNMKTSITRLETYNKCPFSYFAKYILKLEPRRVLEMKVSDSGSFLHDFLDSFSSFIKTSCDKDGTPLSWSSIDAHFIRLHTPRILAEVLKNVNSSVLDIPRIKALFDRLLRVAEQSVFAVKRHIEGGKFVPVGYEISFDENGDFKPIEIKLPDGKMVTLRGRIDRADEYNVTLPNGEEGKFIRIVDYKSSDKQIVLSDVYNGVQLQLFVYLSNLCENGYKPAGILYCNLTDAIVEVSPDTDEKDIIKKREDARRMRGIVIEEENMFDNMGGKSVIAAEKTASISDFNRMFKHLNKVIAKTCEDIYDGKFPIKCTKGACDWCDYASLCRFDTAFSGCSVNESHKLDDEAVWELLKEGTADDLD